MNISGLWTLASCFYTGNKLINTNKQIYCVGVYIVLEYAYSASERYSSVLAISDQFGILKRVWTPD